MPIVATPVDPRTYSRTDLRQFLRDYPGVVPDTGAENILLNGRVEFSDADLDAALRAAVDRYNLTTPISLLGMENIPRPLLMFGAVAHLLASQSFLQLRNQLQAQDGDVAPLGIDDKHPQYLQAAKFMWDQFDAKTKEYKVQRNLEMAFGELGSGYAFMGAWWR